MSELGVGLAADMVYAILSAVGAVLFTVAGVLVDQAGLHNVVAGATAQGAWELWMGTLALFVGLYLLGYQTAWSSISGLR